MRDTREKLQKYNDLKAKVRAIEIDIDEIEDNIIHEGQESDVTELLTRVQTSTISDTTANKGIKLAETIDWYRTEMKYLQREIERIENSIRVLNLQEGKVITMKYFEKKSWATIQLALNDCTYSNVKRVESEAIAKIMPYLRKTVEKL